MLLRNREIPLIAVTLIAAQNSVWVRTQFSKLQWVTKTVAFQYFGVALLIFAVVSLLLIAKREAERVQRRQGYR